MTCIPSLRTIHLTLLIWALFSVSCLVKDEAGKISNSAQKATDTAVVEVKEYADYDVNAAALLDKDGNMWFSSSREGVFKYDGISFTNYTVNDGLSDMHVNTIIQDHDGIIWFGTADGLCYYDGKLFKHLSLPGEAIYHPGDNPVRSLGHSHTVLSLLEDSKNILWIGTCGGGAYSYDGSNFINYLSEQGRKQSEGDYFNVIQSLLEDSDGNIWFTSMTHGGVSKYDGKDFSFYAIKDGLPDDMVFSSFQDSNGDLWFGFLDGGMSRYDGNSFVTISEEDGLCNNMVSAFYEDKDGVLWLASFRDKGVCIYDGEQFSTIVTGQDQSISEIRFLVEDKNGAIWFGGRYGSLWKYDGQELTDFTHRKYN